MVRVLFGTFLILFGLGVFVDQTHLSALGLSSATIMSLFWLVLGILLFIKRHVFWGMVFSAIGLLGFISGFFNINTGALFLPVIFVAIGLSVLFRRPDKWVATRMEESTSNEDFLKCTVAFGACEKMIISKNFQGGKIESAFGGFKIDLINAKIAKEGAVLDINAAFGGGEIIVPKDMRVISEGSGVMGGWNNNYESSAAKDDPALLIKGSAVFGGVEIKN